jgi:UDP-2-acetamido-3-amino-2,3-dideoxy-glucuronate N-acetyltransferase
VPARSEGAVAPAPGLRAADERAPGLLLGEGVELPEDVELGGNVVIHTGTSVGAGCRLADGAVLGRPPALGPRSTAARESPSPLRVGAGATIGAGAVALAGASIGERAVVGDQAHVRERAQVGPESVIGRGSQVENHVTVGARVKVQSSCYLTAYSDVEDDVFVGPGVVTMNDHAMGRHPRGDPLRGVTLQRACRIGGAAALLPGIEVGEEAFVAAGAHVVRSVPSRAVVMGVPARVVREVPEGDLLERWLA